MPPQRFCLFVCLALVGLVHAGVSVETGINDVFNRGSNELSGFIGFRVNGDDFRNASPATPIFIRITPDHNADLARTLVDLSSVDPAINQPILLALKLNGTINTTMNAEPDAVSVVRWVAGEPAFWIRIQQSSDSWLMNGGPRGPDFDNEVSWSVGLSARNTDANNDLGGLNNGSNLPFNTRDAMALEGDFALATSVLLCVNLAESNLATTLLQFDVIAFDEGADVGDGSFRGTTANDTGIAFSNDFSIARGRDRLCNLVMVTADDGTTVDGTLLTHRRVLDFDYNCWTGSPYLVTQMEAGSALTVRTLQPGFGFGTDAARFAVAGEPPGMVVGNPASMVTLNGVDLFTEIDLIWTGATFDFSGDLTVELDIQYDAAAVAAAELDFTLVIATGPDPRDSPPYDGPDQHFRCQPSLYTTSGQNISFDFALLPTLPRWPEEINVLNLVDLFFSARR